MPSKPAAESQRPGPELEALQATVARLERELEIEASLERVRASALAMHTSEDLVAVADTLKEQMGLLGQPLLESIVIEFYDLHEEYFESWYSLIPAARKDGKKLTGKEIFRKDACALFQELLDMYHSSTKEYTVVCKGKELKEWMAVLSEKLPDFATVNVPLMYYSCADFTGGTLVAATLEVPSKDTLELLSRASRVFDLAYLRFLDLKKAEEQAREAQIEAALEKVRSRSLAMHKSEELLEVVKTVFERLKELDLSLDAAAIFIFKEDHFEYWFAATESEYLTPKHLPNRGIVITDEITKAREACKNFISLQLSQAEKNKFFRSIFKLTDFDSIPDERKKFLLECEAMSVSVAIEKNSGIQLNNYSGKSFSEPENEVLKRFGRVFEQAYTRFLDLQKAEEQTREAQIEAALERIRARSMAMQSSEELQEVVQVMYEQVDKLGIARWGCLLMLFDKPNQKIQGWFSDVIHAQYVPFDIENKDHKIIRQLWDFWESAEQNLGIHLKDEEKHDFSKYMLTQTGLKDSPDDFKEFVMREPEVWFEYTNMQCGLIEFIDHEPFPEENLPVLNRISHAFEQAYIRFLDLQKAEAQAREAQIEAALERIRSRSMAMHKSSELSDVIAVVSKQMELLGVKYGGCYVIIFDPLELSATHFFAGFSEGQFLNSYHMPYNEHPYYLSQLDAWRNQEGYKVSEFSGNLKREYDDWLFTETDWREMPEALKNGTREQNYAVLCDAVMTHGLLGAVCPEPLQEDKVEVLQRMARVFDQSYSRFLDLQKAEAQAREAEIQLALERVRARTMAMHKSEELGEVAATLYSELQSLGFEDFVNCGFLDIDEEENIQRGWATMPGAEPMQFFLPLGDEPVTLERYQAWKRGDPLLYQEVGGARLKKHLEFAMPHLGSPEVEAMVKTQFTDPTYFYSGNFSNGYLFVVSTLAFNEEQLALVQKFTSAFELAYTRFLDLQKAEAQAREAQIEAALERIRASSMAMHHSNELPQVALSVLMQIEALEIPHVSCDINIVDNETHDFISYAAHSIGSENEKVTDQLPLLNLNEIGFMREAVSTKNKWGPYNTLELRGKLLEEMMDLWKASNFSGTKNQYIQKKPEVIYLHWAPFNDWSSISLSSVEPLSDEQLSVLARIAKTFSLSYTRFLDLQKAEAQARESQIEAALERVRARALAMHGSSELEEVVKVMREQMGILQQPLLETIAIHLYPDEGDDFESWYALRSPFNDKGDVLSGTTTFSKKETAMARKMLALFHSEKQEYMIEVSGKALDEWQHMAMKRVAGLKEEWGEHYPRHQYWYFVDFCGGSFLLIPREEPSKEAKELLRRSASVFDLAYRRHLDLKKAEAQAREAQIEAALERVRAATMAMHRSEQLPETAKILFQQFHELGKVPDRISIGILNQAHETGKAELWVTDQSGTEVGHRFEVPIAEPSTMQRLYRGWKAKKDTETIDLKGEALKKWIRFVREELHMEIREQHIRGRRVHQGAFFSQGFLLITTHQPIGAELMELLRRFARVFDQTYTRFLDLQRAEAQAREAEIQLALERVRAATMAMHSSSELSEVAAVLFQQMRELGVTPERVNIGIVQEQEGFIEYWSTEQGGRQIDRLFKGSIDEPTTLSKLYAGWKAGQPVLELHQSGKELAQWIRHLTEVLGIPFDERFRQERRVQTAAYFKHGMLLISTPDPVSEESLDLLGRFGKVFEQTYTRFLDLQRAEAQAREAQIEAALERVRARAMAMHSSNELIEVANVMHEQMTLLQQSQLEAFVIHLYPEKGDQFEAWVSQKTPGKENRGLTTTLTLSKNETKLAQQFFKLYLSEPKEYLIHAYGELLGEWNRMVITRIKGLKKAWGKNIPTSQYWFFSDFSGGSFLLVSRDEPNEESKELTRRASSVFDLAYRRFLDLQRAEAQAREAQIEAALERVRAASMAMRTSLDLGDILAKIFAELKSLEVEIDRCFIWVVEPEKEGVNCWIASPQSGSASYWFPFFDHPYFEAFMDVWREQKNLFKLEIQGVLKKSWDQYLFETTEFVQLPPEAKDTMRIPEKIHATSIANKYGLLCTAGQNTMSEEHIGIFRRFGAMFEQTYTRFLDLEKAEAQAREAQIEAALERVRARSMAMHKSDEMLEVGESVYRELSELGIASMTSGITLMDPDGKIDWYYMVSPEDGSIMKNPMGIPRDETKVMRSLTEGWEHKKPFHLVELDEKETILHQTYIAENSINFELTAEELISVTPEKLNLQTFNFKQGFLLLVGAEKLVGDQIDTTIRFAKAFEQAYTRFLDLQKAEAQAREAEIQLALERIRARSMAMQSSEELREVVQVMYEQVEKLGIAKWGCMLLLFDKPNQKIQGWFSDVIHSQYPRPFEFTDHDHEIIRKWWGFWESDAENLSIHLKDDEKHDFSRYLFSQTGMKDLPEDFKEFVMREPEVWFEYTNMDCGLIEFIDHEPFPEASIPVLNRISQAFEQAYTRFLDLQRAEAQAREAQIEAALERVRAKTMAMHNTEDIGATVAAFFRELVGLGLDASIRCGIGILSQSALGELWTASEKDSPEDTVQRGYLDMAGHPLLQNTQDTWARGEPGCSRILKGEAVRAYYRHINEAPDYPVHLDPEKAPEVLYHTGFHFRDGSLYAFTPTPLADEIRNILERFAAVFGQTYTRYLDLQQAEQRAREARIEAALERVRAKTMAMHNTDDIAATVSTFFKELLGLEPDTSMRCGVGILSQSEHMELWTASIRDTTQSVLHAGTLDMSRHPLLKGVRKMWAGKEKAFAYTLKGSDLKRYYQVLNEAPDYPAHFDLKAIPKVVYHNSLAFRDGVLFVFTESPLQDDIRNILERFAAVFGQTYTRYLDLQKAEQRARESEIEAGLERVRARSMAMHKSQELLDLSVVLFQELEKLGVRGFFNCGFVEVDEEKQKQSGWTTMTDGSMGEGYYLPLRGDSVLDTRYRAWKQGEPVFCQKVSGQELEAHMAFAMPTLGSERVRQMAATFPDPTYFYCFNFSHGYLSIISGEVLDPEAESILVRFTRAFEQAYIRFMDLQKAEAQAREAQIEAALERVRSRSMAMHHTGELQDVINTVYQQFLELRVPITGGAFIAINADIGSEMVCWGAGGTAEYIQEVHLPFMDMPIYTNLVAGIKKGPGFFVESFSREEKQQFFKALFRNPPYSEAPASRKKEILSRPGGYTRSCVVSRNTSIFIINHHGQPFSEEDNEILRRMGKVFEQTYTRFLDLQTAEAQAREASRQASIERVRGEIASMRSTADLERITPLIWNELTALGVPFIRCGVFIIQEQTQTIQTYLSAPDGHALGVMNLDFEAGETTRETVAHWRRKEAYQPRWTAEEFTAWTESLLEAGKINDRKTYQDTERPPEMLYLNFIPFAQGMLYVGNTAPLEEEALELIQSLAEAFSFAYARYEDFNQLEKAISDLKATQAQLIQSEKMASLGELTAGIAHEIKNPLNFVNNFSEVSRELLEELVEELEKGDIEEVRALARDVSQNLEKIVHHGMRADGIVKGMLQHSRSGDGKKEPTDLNALADEYLRLAYHGLRAKDKSFNATLETGFDPKVGLVELIPQDMGRVILNLLTNAFYAVSEKAQEGRDGYVPTVAISTAREGGHVLVSVTDNGNGIPEKVREKIFQPFFTTKPTGEGTGLGLSMSYDIVTKGHGGSLEVKTESGVGTTFVIKLNPTPRA